MKQNLKGRESGITLLGKLPGLTSWEFVHLIMWSLSHSACAGCHLHVSPDVFSLESEAVASLFIPLAKRGDS